MTQDKDQMRAEFEAWCCPQADKNAITKLDDGFYMSAKTSMAWGAWQAARASAQAVPEGWQLVPVEATREMIDAMSRVEETGYWAMYEAALAAASAP